MAKAHVVSDKDILASVAPPGCSRGDVTYVVANRLRMRPPHGFGHKVETRAVLRRLKRLEQAGKVERTETSYAVMIAWRRVNTGEVAHG